MINIHLNGDIIRCPDIAGIYLRNQQLKDAKCICKYGYPEKTCDAWQKRKQQALNESNWDNKKNLYSGRCLLAGTIDCPGHLSRKKNGNKEKTFEINNQVYRKVASTAHYLVHESKCKSIFITLTFPPFQKEHKLTKHIFENEILNSCFSKFVENLVENYKCKGYIAVRERGKNGNRVHFHLLLSIPFISFARLNDSWCNTIQNICEYSDHALTSKRKKVIIYEPARALRYICKYVSKARGQKSDCRIVFMSNNIIQKSKQMRQSTESVLDSYKFDYMRRTSDYTTCFRITDYKEFHRFCDTFLYPFFELSADKPHHFTSDYLDTG